MIDPQEPRKAVRPTAAVQARDARLWLAPTGDTGNDAAEPAIAAQRTAPIMASTPRTLTDAAPTGSVSVSATTKSP